MSERVEIIVYGRDLPFYSHGPFHPLKPERVTLTLELIEALGLIDGQRVRYVQGRDCTEEELLLVHTAEFLEATMRASRGEGGRFDNYGYGAVDNPAFPKMHETAMRVVGCTLTAAERILNGRTQHAFNPWGGLHHAMPARASGFCVYNDVAIAMKWLLKQGVPRIAYVDVDVHHADGVQTIFNSDPRVLTISLHQEGRWFFPATGWIDEMGADEAYGTKVNVPFPAETGDEAWMTAFREVVPPLVRAFGPTILVTQLGCDTHHSDQQASLNLTLASYAETAQIMHSLAHEVCDGRWLATGGGGYQWARVVPRAWALYVAEMCDQMLADDLPMAWVDRASLLADRAVPFTFSEAPVEGLPYEPQVANLVREIKETIFPMYGIVEE